ncbi:MAG: hypothetical protein AAGF94_03295 [Pseudomonadota bacterium]
MTFTFTPPWTKRRLNIIGPYSAWPRQSTRKRAIIFSSTLAGLAVFVHCGLPMIV